MGYREEYNHHRGNNNMTKKDAIRAGRDVAFEIATYGEFTDKEMESRESYLEACYEISENRKQYAGDVTEDFRRDSEWEGYEEGLNIGLSKEANILFGKE
jgi:hypothetical protein